MSDTDYYTRLSLACDPFARDALPDFFFVGAQRRFLVQRAVHALYFSGATVLLLGANGVGKTRTLDEIEKELNGLVDICRIEATVLMDTAEIRGLLAAAIGLPSAVVASNSELAHALERMRPADGDPQPVLLAIDAAQLLSITTLAECSALIAGAGGRLRLLFVGEAGLATAWQQAQAGVAEMLELAPLDRNETADYVRTKLQAAGYRGEQPLSDTEFDNLFAQSGGNFAAINALAPQLLQPVSEPSPVARRIKALPMLHIGVIAALLAGVILLMLYRGGASQSSTSAPLPQSPDKKNSATQNTVALKLPEAPVPSTTSPSVILPAPAVAETTSAETSPPVSVPIENKTSAPPENKKAAAEKRPVAEKKEAAEKAKPADAREKTVAANTQPSSLSEDERALLAFPSSNCVLQLMGAESKVTVDKFASGAGKGLKLYTYHTQLRGKSWFIVLTGPYADKSAALAAQAKLPEAVRKQQPWPRTLANVQADIRAHSGR